MELFEEMTGYRNHHSRKHRDHHDDRHRFDRYQDNRYSSGARHAREDDYRPWSRGSFMSHMHLLLREWLRNKKIVGFLLLLAAVLLVLAVAGLIFLFPFVLKMLGLVGENGLAGVLEQARPAVDALWQGAGK